MSFLRPLADGVSSITSKTFSRKFVSLSRILSSWPDIVGHDMAGRAQPVKLNYRKPKDSKESPKATLEIAVSSADSVTLHYQTDLILERINQIFGERWITSIRFVHQAANKPDESEPPPIVKTLSAQDEATVSASLDGIEDPDLRKQLEMLGHAVLRKKRPV